MSVQRDTFTPTDDLMREPGAVRGTVQCPVDTANFTPEARFPSG